jgi:hypothetical protein
MRKGQTSVEVVILTAVLLVIFILFLVVISNRNNVSLFLSKKFSAQELGYTAVNAVNGAYIGGYGTNTTIYLPSRLASESYNISIINATRLLRISYDGIYEEFPLITRNVTGRFVKGSLNYVVNDVGVIKIE